MTVIKCCPMKQLSKPEKGLYKQSEMFNYSVYSRLGNKGNYNRLSCAFVDVIKLNRSEISGIFKDIP